MKVTAATVIGMLSRLRVYFKMTTDARDAHRLQATRTADQLLKRLADNEHTLLEVRNLLVGNVKAGKAITPGGEWLLDNFYLIEEQVILAREAPGDLILTIADMVEPYVMAADVYASQTHKGMGGWTWYTGSAGWMYQFVLGSLIGLERQGELISFRLIDDGQPHIVEMYVGIEKKHINHTIHDKLNHLYVSHQRHA